MKKIDNKKPITLKDNTLKDRKPKPVPYQKEKSLNDNGIDVVVNNILKDGFNLGVEEFEKSLIRSIKGTFFDTDNENEVISKIHITKSKLLKKVI
jgi:hypothetical protein